MTSHWTVNCTRRTQYTIETTHHLFDPTNLILLSGGRPSHSRRFVVVDSAVYDLYGKQLTHYFAAHSVQANIVRFVAGEVNKSLSAYQTLLSALENLPIDRRSEPIIAIGGGVLTDLVGFLASTYRRGVPHIKVPTTLMGSIDAAIGIKTGINIQNYKNRLGSFEPPYKVILDHTFLSTLSKRHLLNGMAEIVKLAIIGDLALFECLEKRGLAALAAKFQNDAGRMIIEGAITGILKFLEPNLYEDRLARELDFGHTFSPVMEMMASSAFFNTVEQAMTPHLLHGEAVIVDVVMSVSLAHLKNLLSQESLERIFSLIHTLGFTLNFDYVSKVCMWQSLIERTHHRDGQQQVPLPKEIGQCIFVNDLTEDDLNAICHFLSTRKTYVCPTEC